MTQYLRKAGLLAAAAALFLPVCAPAQTVQTVSGPVEGVTRDDVSGFRGIPFAAVPVGPLRWRSPQPVASWTRVRPAKENAPACVQDMSMLIAMGEAPLPVSEDCLYLNVWKPAKLTKPAPVMVWIHGGGFTTGGTGAAMFDGAALARRGLVVVTVAYRLGALGFLGAPGLRSDLGLPGNFGLEDQIAGLRWVKANVARFGGDPSNVTLFGESAGAYSVSALAGSPAAAGLFHKVIAQSGGAFAPARTGGEGGLPFYAPSFAREKGARFLAALGAGDLDAARTAPAADVLKASTGEFGEWAPTRDGKVVAIDQYGAYRQGAYNRTPALVGYNSDEGSLFVQQMTGVQFTGMVRAGYGSRAEAILAAYPHATDAEALASARQLMGDTIFGWPAMAWARLQAAHKREPVYVYFNDHVPPLPPGPMFKGARAFHGSELAFVFGNPNMPAWGPEDHRFSAQLMAYWTNFAKTGNPNGAGLTAWPAFDPADPKVLKLDTDSTVIAAPGKARFEALDAYYAMRRGEAGGAR